MHGISYREVNGTALLECEDAPINWRHELYHDLERRWARKSGLGARWSRRWRSGVEKRVVPELVDRVSISRRMSPCHRFENRSCGTKGGWGRWSAPWALRP